VEVKWKRGGISQSLIVVSGLIFLIGAVLTYFFILRGVYGPFNTSKLIPDSKVLRSVISGTKPTVGILYSQYTQNMLPEGSTWLNDNITTWKKFLENEGLKYDVITDKAIELGLLSNYELLVLPGSKSLSDRELIEIKKFLNDGGSVFATSGTASYSDDGKWRGWEFFSEVFGLNFTKEISNDEFTKLHTLRGNFPITANIPTGYSLRVGTWDKPISVEVMDPRTTQISFWYNFKSDSGLVRENIKKSAGIVTGTYGRGRFLWMGFELNSVIGAQEDYIYFDKLFSNSIKWLTYKPIAFAKDWPAGYDAAAMIAPIVDKDPENIENLLNILKSENVKVTFFINPQQAKLNRGLIKSLSQYGEIGSLVDIGYLNSVNDTINSLNDYDTQVQKFKNAKSLLEEITEQKVNGTIPYYGLFDQNTLKALTDDGYSYVVTDSLTDRSVPRKITLDNKDLTIMTKTARDDYEVIRDFGLTDTEFQYYTYQEDIDRILFEGGMYLFKMHTEYQCTSANINVVKEVIDDLKRKNFWIATGKEIENWYARKSSIEIRADKRGANRIALTISNPGSSTANNLVVQVELDAPADKITMDTEIIGTKKAKYDFDKKNKIVYVYVNDLEPNESRTYYLDFSQPNS
jgi:peptidoglycan/xylan/chitin deacetylase (PgdA/CDA1 family)